MRNNGGARFGFNNADDEGEQEEQEQEQEEQEQEKDQFSDYFVKSCC